MINDFFTREDPIFIFNYEYGTVLNTSLIMCYIVFFKSTNKVCTGSTMRNN